MKKLTANDPETRSADLLSENVERLKELFPEAVAEGKIDFDALKQLLGGEVDEREEKYGLNWHGKRQARQIALTPSTGTLRPCPEESVDWDTTQNLMIEGDNLEILKLLQKSYAGKVKLIYIDPPYNTGKDFVYPDNFKDNIKNYLELTGQTDDEGRKITSNAESSGRFHTDWLNMMYPRLKLARSLLTEDGLIFLSIDDNEIENLRRICDEIFGEENLVETFVWKKSYGGGAKERFAVTQHEYCVLYSRQKNALSALWLPPDADAEARYYKGKDEKVATRGPFRIKPLEATKSMEHRANLVFPIPAPDGTEIHPKRQWWWSRDRVFKTLKDDGLVFVKTDDGWSVSYKQYLKDDDGKTRGAKPFSIIDGIYTQKGTADLRALFDDEVVVQFPKPVDLIRKFLDVSGDSNGLVVDFFAGSGTTGHAVYSHNLSDNGRRRVILVQLPEPISKENRDQKVGADFCKRIGKPSFLSELTKERLRRAGKKIKDENPMFAGDVGFRVFKLATSNIRAWEPDRDDLAETLEDAVVHLKADRTEQDILYELLLKLGLDLTVPIEQRKIGEHEAHSVGAGALLVCLSKSIPTDQVEGLGQGIVAWHKELKPEVETMVVFRDSAFGDDVAKTNLTKILEQNGLDHVRSL